MKLPDYRYEEIKRTAVDVICSTGINAIPYDIFEMARKLDLRLISYGELSCEAQVACNRYSESGFALFYESYENPDNSGWRIYYNEAKNAGHVRFTILHEMGHIFLKHCQESEVAEAEANFFAKFVIAPPALVNLLKPADYVELVDEFHLSFECALNSWHYYKKWIRVPERSDYDYELVSLFGVQASDSNSIKPRLKKKVEHDESA